MVVAYPESSSGVNTKFIFEPVVINYSVVAPRDSMRSGFRVEPGSFMLSFQKGVRVASLLLSFQCLSFS